MCTYNGDRFLGEQLRSIAVQTVIPDELVVCDDCSSDSTIQILENFAATAPFPVRILRNPKNLGSTQNFAKAIGLCRGELIALSDQDDVWHEQKLAKLADMFADRQVGGVFSDGELIDGDGRVLSSSLWRVFGFTAQLRIKWQNEGAASVLLRQNIVTGATLMFRSRLRELFLPIPTQWIHDGWIAWIISLAGRLDFISLPLIYYRIHTAQQAGIPGLNAKARLLRATQDKRDDFELAAKQFECLRDHVMSNEQLFHLNILNVLRNKIDHCYFRAGLPENRLSRFTKVWSHLSEYAENSRGFREALKDMIR